MPHILIVDDNHAICTALQVLFEVHGFETVVAHDPATALELVAREDIGCVVQDMNFTDATTSGEEGEALLKAIHQLDPELPVVLMTAWTSVERAVEMMKRGAKDYVGKPWNDARLVTSVSNLLRLREVSQENRRLKGVAARARSSLARFDLRGLVFESAAMHEVLSLATRVAPADVSVLIIGPPGVGKEQLAEVLQANSRRASKPFVKVNAGGLPETLLEAELFGAEAGSYTGANKLRIGRFEEAHGGTLFLDEIGNLSAAGQAKLLRVLQTGELQRLGSNVQRKVDVRVVSATNADLPRMMKEGTFRDDLYYRLATIELVVPPLRARPEDVLPLARALLARHRPDPTLEFSPEAITALLAHDWPGNVRELQNRIQRATLVATPPRLTPKDLGLTPTAPPAGTAEGPPLSADEQAERQSIEAALARAGGVVSRAAAELGLTRQSLYRRMERLGLSLERRVRG